MKIITWNVRGLNAPKKQRILKCCISDSKPNLMLIQETKMNASEISLFEQKLGVRQLKHSPATGASGGLAIIWDSRTLLFTPLEIQQNWIGGDVVSYKNNLRFKLINVYGPI